MKKNDFILLGIILIVAALGFGVYAFFSQKDVGMVTVTVDGTVYGTYSLKKEQEIKIQDTNILIIKEGQADMIEADCPDQVCVKHKAISKNRESIICLPNKVVVEVNGGEEAKLDSIAK